MKRRRSTVRQTSGHPIASTVDLRRRLAGRALDVFRGWGYDEIDVPLLDHFDPLRTALDPKQVNRMFRFVDRDGNLLVLRADVTPAIAKIYVHQLADAPLPLRLCYANKVVRIERAFTREQIESYQLGIELIGVEGAGPEIEVILVAIETLRAIGVADFEVHIGNAALVDHLIGRTGAPRSLREPLANAIADRDGHAVSELIETLGCRDEIGRALIALTELSFDDASLSALSAQLPGDELLAGRIDDMRQRLTVLGSLGLSDLVYIDLGLVNEQGYYTGTTFKVVSERVGRVLGGGGRYDELIGRFGRDTAAVVIDPAALGTPIAASEAARVAEADMAAGFAAALEKRAEGTPTRVRYE